MLNALIKQRYDLPDPPAYATVPADGRFVAHPANA